MRLFQLGDIKANYLFLYDDGFATRLKSYLSSIDSRRFCQQEKRHTSFSLWNFQCQKRGKIVGAAPRLYLRF